MKVKIRLVDSSLTLPMYQTAGAAAQDLLVREAVTIPPRGIAHASLNVCLKLPRGHFALLAARSSLHKRGLMLANGVGVIDEDFCGDNDEYKAVLYNFTDSLVLVKKGDRLVQVVILPVERVEWEPVLSTQTVNRGAFGTTGEGTLV